MALHARPTWPRRHPEAPPRYAWKIVNGPKCMTQPKARPPTFAIFTNRPAELPDSYLRFLGNGLRDAFDLDGVPLRLNLRRGANPYA